MYWHIIEGEEGCRFAVEQGCVAVVADALRASATAAMLLHAGAKELLVVREVEEARAAKAADPEALLFGERGGLPLDGFDGGNSPRQTSTAEGKRVIFTTTTGAGRLVSAWGARAVYLGTTVNAAAVVEAAREHRTDVVLIPAGLAGNPDFNAQEDVVAAAYLAMLAGGPVGEGADLLARWQPRIESEGLDRLFATAPHAEKLRQVGLEKDVVFCAQTNQTQAVPTAIAREKLGVRVGKWGQ